MPQDFKGGTKASDGYAALRELDTNQDGRIDSQDIDFSKLQVWTDNNGDFHRFW